MPQIPEVIIFGGHKYTFYDLAELQARDRRENQLKEDKERLEKRILNLEADKKYMAARIKSAMNQIEPGFEFLVDALSARGLNDESSFSNSNPEKFPKSVGVRGGEFNGR